MCYCPYNLSNVYFISCRGGMLVRGGNGSRFWRITGGTDWHQNKHTYSSRCHVHLLIFLSCGLLSLKEDTLTDTNFINVNRLFICYLLKWIFCYYRSVTFLHVLWLLFKFLEAIPAWEVPFEKTETNYYDSMLMNIFD